MIWLLTASNMPDCVASASFANIALGHKVVLVKHTISINTDNFNTLFPNVSDTDVLVIIGTFWKRDLDFISNRFGKTMIYAFTDKIVGNDSAFIDTNKEGAIQWLSTVFSPDPVFMSDFDEILKLCNIRCFGQGNEKVQELFNGVYARSRNGDNYAVFNDLFTKKISPEQIIELGRLVLENNIQIVNDRVQRSSKLYKLNQGMASISEGTDMINLTHDALRKKYNTDITVVFRYDFSEHGDKMCYSVRSHNPSISALDILKNLENSGGSDSAAGGQTSTNFQLQF